MAPQVFAGKYIVQEEIARGGMGVIYRALDRTLNRIVAIKLVHAHLSGDASFAERFLREARAMARLQHEHIVSIYAVEEDGGTQFLVMEFCPGRNLREVIRKQPARSVRDVLRLAQQLASALAYAHAQGVIHRDIKPANVLVDKHGKAKLTDFGIAAALDEAALTSAGQVIGTPEYMSPEQARGLKLDGRSDLFSLGIVMYEMLTGRTPYAESSGTSILGTLASDRGELTLQFPSHVPPVVQGVVRDLLRRDRDSRISDAETLANQLPEILYTVPETSPVTALEESEPTIVSTVPAPPLHIDRGVSSQVAATVIAPPPSEPLSNRSPVHDRPEARAVEDHTVALPPPDRLGSGPEKRVPISLSPSEVVAPPPARPFGLIIAVGVLILGLTAIGFISYFGSQPESGRSDNKPGETEPAPEPPPDVTSKRIDDTLKPREENLTKLDQLLRDASARFQAGLATVDCPSLKTLLFETYEKYEHTIREVNQLRQELGREPAVPIHPASLDTSCEGSTAPPPVVTGRNPPLAPPLPIGEPKPEPTPSKTSSTPAQPPNKAEPVAPPVRATATFPDEQLQSLLDRFKRAYEQRDWETLRAVSRMDEARLRNVETMFRTYKTFTLSVASITPYESGARANVVIESAIKTTGELLDLPPIAKKITLTIPRQGDHWDKIVW